jgi:hypothetical protein
MLVLMIEGNTETQSVSDAQWRDGHTDLVKTRKLRTKLLNKTDRRTDGHVNIVNCRSL